MAIVSAFAQDTAKTSSNAKHKDLRNSVLLCFNYGRHIPVGILAQRFGNSNSVGFLAAYKFGNNLQVQAGVNTIFGSQVKENGIFDTLIRNSGYLIDVNGNYAEVKQYQRGYNWHIDIGKIIPINKFDKNSGLLLTAGLGFTQHNIKYTFQRTVLPQLEGEYAKGYDRLTNGLLLRGFLGYQRIDPKSMFNFIIGIEFLNGITQNRRAYNYDTRMADLTRRNDTQIGLKLGFMIALSGRQAGTKKGEEERYFD
ncbi:MAG: hypothetical protein IT245_09140 [Bacteroidia bacterium]|nr:hypothetical protein [Bacteroidia bacterium]